MSCQVRFLSFCFWFFLVVFFQNIFFQRNAFANSKPLILQWEVAHFKNRDQISLIFRKDTVELVTNTSSWQKKQSNPLLGRFGSPMTLKLKLFKRQITQSHIRLKQTVSMLSLIKDSRFRSLSSPHASIARINGKEIKRGHPYFEPLARIIRQVWQIEWICLECAMYQRKGNAILRTAQTGPGLIINPKEKATKGIIEKTFSKKELSCISKTRGKMECVDPLFGIFEL